MVLSSKSRPGWRLAHCAAALALSLALPAFADDEGVREERDEPFQIEFDNPCTPDHLSGQGRIRTESRTKTKGNTTEFREHSHVTGRPMGTPSLAIYNFDQHDQSVTRTSATTFKFKERRRVQGIPDRKTGATGLPVAAFFVTSEQEFVSSPKQQKNKVDSDTKCKDRQGRDIDAG